MSFFQSRPRVSTAFLVSARPLGSLAILVILLKLPTLATPAYWDEMSWVRQSYWLSKGSLLRALPGLRPASVFWGHPPGLHLTLVVLWKLFNPSMLVVSSNYVLNDVLDAPYDIEHSIKRLRPVPSGQVGVQLALVQWILLMVAGVSLGFTVSRPFAITLLILWITGTIYNLEPSRSKDIPYIDVLSEALNNPLRMLAGWFIVDLPATIIPISLLLSCWMIGCYFMGIKRYAEFRHLRDVIQMERYRPPFAFYSESRLLASIMFYASAAMLFLGAFIMRYRMELILSFPLVATVMAIYLMLAFKPDSAVQAPEKLYREPLLMISVTLCATTMAVLLFVDIPILYAIFRPTLPTPLR